MSDTVAASADEVEPLSSVKVRSFRPSIEARRQAFTQPVLPKMSVVPRASFWLIVL